MTFREFSDRHFIKSMPDNKFYSLPSLPFSYSALEPYMSKEQLTIHQTKHHQAYVDGANAILEKLDKAHARKIELDIKCALKELSFQIGGFILHSLFWQNLILASENANTPTGKIAEKINENFNNFTNFKNEFTKAAMSVEGSGWVALVHCPLTGRLLTMQIEKHNTNIYPTFNILMVIDAFEHAYYIDYKNAKAKYFEAVWQIINWEEVNKRLK